TCGGHCAVFIHFHSDQSQCQFPKADLASMEHISLVKCWLREAGAHNVLVTSAVNNNGVTELFALLHTEEGCC
ncbi:EutP/PduV family microcompartment system protein, partial [Escherichia coli]